MSSLKRVFFTSTDLQNHCLTVQGDVYHHLFRVCRLEPGANLVLVDEAYQEYQGTVQAIDTASAVIAVKGFAGPVVPRVQTKTIHLGLALLKGPAMDWAIQKACELGVTSITPLTFTRSVVKLDAEAAKTKQTRWQTLAQEAAQQAKLLFVPHVNALTSVGHFGAGVEAPVLQIFCNEHEKDITLKHLAEAIAAAQAVYIITGPEGGFTLEESEYLKRLVWHSVSLGASTLRAETAPLAALAQLQLIMGS